MSSLKSLPGMNFSTAATFQIGIILAHRVKNYYLEELAIARVKMVIASA